MDDKERQDMIVNEALNRAIDLPLVGMLSVNSYVLGDRSDKTLSNVVVNLKQSLCDGTYFKCYCRKSERSQMVIAFLSMMSVSIMCINHVNVWIIVAAGLLPFALFTIGVLNALFEGYVNKRIANLRANIIEKIPKSDREAVSIYVATLVVMAALRKSMGK